METVKPLEDANQISSWEVDRPSIIGLLIQIGITITAIVVGIIFVNICRKFKWGKTIYFKRLYVLPKNTPKYKDGFVELVKHISSVPEQWIIDNIGLDAAMYIRMFKIGIVIFAFGSLVVAPVLLPVNYFAQTPDYEHYDNSTIPFLSIGLKRFSIANVPNDSNLHIVHAVFIYILTFFICKKLFDYYMEYLKYDYEYKKEDTIRAHKERLDELVQFRTVLVQGIPTSYRTDKALKQWFIDHNIGEVENAFVMRDYDEYFVNIYKKRKRTLYALEDAYCTWIRDIIDYKERNKDIITNSNNDLCEIVTNAADVDHTKINEKEKEEEGKKEGENAGNNEKRTDTLSYEPTLIKLELEVKNIKTSGKGKVEKVEKEEKESDGEKEEKGENVEKKEKGENVEKEEKGENVEKEEENVEGEEENEEEEKEEENNEEEEKEADNLSNGPSLTKSELENLKKEVEKEEDVLKVHKKKVNSSTNDTGINEEDVKETTPLLNNDETDMQYIIDALRPKALKASTGHYVDSIDYYTEKLIKYTKIINETRKRFFDDDDDPSVYTSSGFVTFKTQLSSTIASQVLLCSSNNTLNMICSPAPHYNDLSWEDLDISVERKITQNFILSIFTGILIIFWSIPISFISGLASMDKLESIDWLQTHFPYIFNMENLELLQTLIPPIMTGIFMTAAPYIFYYISSFQCYESRSAKEQSVMGKYYIFLLVNMLFVFALANAFITFVTAFIDSPMSILYTIGSLIPQGSTYFINLVAHYPVSLVVDSIKPYLPVLYWLNKKLCNTPRDYYKLKYETYYPDYCYLIPPYLVIIVISVVYSLISPLIVFAGLAFCIIGYYYYKYQILYFYVKEWEDYGKQWIFIHNQIVIGLLLLQVIMMGIFEVKGCYITGISLLPIIFFTLFYYYFFRSTYEKRTLYLPLDQFSSSKIDYSNYKKEQKGKQEEEEEGANEKGVKEKYMEEVKNSQKQAKVVTTHKVPGYYQNHTYFWPMITKHLSGLWIPEKAKEVLSEDIIKKIGRLPEENSVRDELKLTEKETRIPCYFDKEWSC